MSIAQLERSSAHYSSLEVSSRLLVLHGTREDALEQLPVCGHDERLDVERDRISLAVGACRIDVEILAEALVAHEPQFQAILLVEVSLSGVPEVDLLDFTERYRAANRRRRLH